MPSSAAPTPDPASDTQHGLPPAFASVVGLLLLLLFEPALANKFETIGGGVSGSSSAKLDWLRGFLYVAGGISLLSSIMAVLVPHNNPLFLNFRNWKQSAAVLLAIAVLCFGTALLI
jgi:hypothetical protein